MPLAVYSLNNSTAVKSFKAPSEKLKELLEKPVWSEEDKQWLFHYLENNDKPELQELMERNFREDLLSNQSHPESDRILHAIHETIEPAGKKRRLLVLPVWKKWTAIAASLIVISAGVYYLMNHLSLPEKDSLVQQHTYKNDVAPGHNGAVLTLSDGKEIVLDSSSNGLLAMQGNIKIEKKDGQIAYNGRNGAVLYNHVSTNKGRQWVVVLPDGSKAWLNAASSIHYPLTFNSNERLVEITGEVYFDVVHNDRQPFRVKVADQLIEDIGTQFNINAYANEDMIRTTLVEGAVKLSNTIGSVFIHPGQQAFVNASSKKIQVAETNVEDVVAWKNGFFAFRNSDIYAVMRQLARWYDVDIRYEGAPAHQRFSGKIDRNLSLAQVLQILDETKAHFRIEEDKRIVILP